MTVPTVALHDGTTIPQLGFGTFQVAPEETESIVATALDVGYRHLDTAQMYHNEEGVGAAIAASAIPRDELYVTTKLDNINHRPADVRRSFEESLAKLGLERLDLFLIHWPLPTRYDGDFVSTWRAMADLLETGRVTSIGVSNFEPDHLEAIIDKTGVVPVVNQVEVHPFFDNSSVREANRRHGVITQAWSPIARGQVFEDDVMNQIASATSRTAAQVALRWHLQRGDVVFPKSNRRERMVENFGLFDFTLSEDQMQRISALDRGADGRRGPNPATFDYLPEGHEGRTD